MTARVLITGVEGFVGGHLARVLAERGDVALGAGLEPPSAETRALLADFRRMDVRDGDALGTMLRESRPTAVVHLAAQSSAAASFEHPVETYSINALGTYTLLDQARRVAPEARVLVVGTGDVYGPQPEGSRADESTPLEPVNPYVLSKAAADVLAEACGRSFGLDVIRTRSFGHLGPGQTDRFAVASWCRQIARIESRGEEPVLRVGNLQVTRDLTDVRDVARAYLAILARGRAGAVYNVCRGEGTRLDAVAEGLRRRARVPVRIEIDAARMRPADIPYLVGDPTRLAADTGWAPSIPLERTLDETLEEWRAAVARGD